MKIAHLIGGLSTGGAEALVADMAIELCRGGVDVSITTLGSATGVPADRARQEGIRITELKRRRWDPRLLRSVMDCFSENDVVHVHLFPSLYWAALVSVRSRTPWVYTEHNSSNRRRGKPLLYGLERFAYSRASEIVAISSGVRDALEEHFGEIGIPGHMLVVPNGIQDRFFQPRMGVRKKSDVLRVISIGTMDNRKNFQLALEAMRLTPCARLKLVGDGPQWNELRSTVSRYGLESRVEMLHKTSRVITLLDESDVLLSTSLIEGFGLVAVEAMARGLPVVAPEIPGIGEVVENGASGVFYAHGPDAAHEISQVLTALHRDPAWRMRLSNGALLRARNFGIRETTESYLRIYESVHRRAA